MRRREFIGLIGGAAAAWPPILRAAAPTPTIGFLSSTSARAYDRFLAAFKKGLGETGYTEGRNVTLQYRWADDQYARLAEMASDLVHKHVDVIAANGPAAVAAKAITSDIPVIFAAGLDPVEVGLVDSLSRPGRNITGVTISNVEVTPKRLQLLHELVPTAAVVGILVNSANPNATIQLKGLQEAAKGLGLQSHVLLASSEADLEHSFTSLKGLRAGALVIGADPFFNAHSAKLASLSVQYKMPAAYQYREFAAAGGLMSYGGSIVEAYRQAGTYVGRVLKGERVSDLPVQQATQFELFVNMKTAKALGITVPIPLLGRADEVIE